MSKPTYAEKLKDPRWQKKRLELLESKLWCCEFCGNEKKQLQIHHQFYLRNTMPWEYPNFCYKVLCETCHGSAQNSLEVAHAVIAKNELIEQLAALETGTAEDLAAFDQLLNIAYEIPSLRSAKLKALLAMCASVDSAFQCGLSVP